MGHMKYEHTKPYEDFFWKKNKIDLLFDHVNKVCTKTKTLSLKSGAELQYDTLIVASGSKSNKFGWPGQELKGVQGLYSYPDLQLMEEYSKGLKLPISENIADRSIAIPLYVPMTVEEVDYVITSLLKIIGS